MEYFLGDNPIINLNSFLGHINYVYYLYTRPLQKEKMASLLLINGTGFLLMSPRCSERSLKGNTKYIPVGLGTHRRGTDFSSGYPVSSCGMVLSNLGKLTFLSNCQASLLSPRLHHPQRDESQ